GSSTCFSRTKRAAASCVWCPLPIGRPPAAEAVRPFSAIRPRASLPANQNQRDAAREQRDGTGFGNRHDFDELRQGFLIAPEPAVAHERQAGDESQWIGRIQESSNLDAFDGESRQPLGSD